MGQYLTNIRRDESHMSHTRRHNMNYCRGESSLIKVSTIPTVTLMNSPATPLPHICLEHLHVNGNTRSSTGTRRPEPSQTCITNRTVRILAALHSTFTSVVTGSDDRIVLARIAKIAVRTEAFYIRARASVRTARVLVSGHFYGRGSRGDLIHYDRSSFCFEGSQ